MFPLVLLVLLVAPLRTGSMQITSSGPQTIQKPRGSTVTLGCTYTPSPSDSGELDVEWSNLSPDMTQKDQLVLSFSGGQTHQYGGGRRLSFTSDPSLGDASVLLSDLQLTDTATYQCKVKRSPGVDTRKVTLVVMVPPSVPKCWVEGGEEKGSDVSLRCESSQGSKPLTYSWSRETGGPLPPTATHEPQAGELLLKNHSDANAGRFLCQVKNAVGAAQCHYELHAYNPTNKVGVIVGAVIGALLLLLLLLLLIWLLICCCQKRCYEREVSNELSEDVTAPTSRATSRASSLRSVLGYRTHHVIYSSVKKAAPGGGAAADHTRGSGRAPEANGSRPLQYDHRYGYPV